MKRQRLHCNLISSWCVKKPRSPRSLHCCCCCCCCAAACWLHPPSPRHSATPPPPPALQQPKTPSLSTPKQTPVPALDNCARLAAPTLHIPIQPTVTSKRPPSKGLTGKHANLKCTAAAPPPPRPPPSRQWGESAWMLHRWVIPKAASLGRMAWFHRWCQRSFRVRPSKMRS